MSLKLTPATPTSFAQITADTLNKDAVMQIIRFFEKSAEQGAGLLNVAERARLKNTAADLRTILRWAKPVESN